VQTKPIVFADFFCLETKTETRKSLMNIGIDPAQDQYELEDVEGLTVQLLIQQYLQHHCYTKTLEHLPVEDVDMNIQVRKDIRDCILKGNRG
jgi:hypothetical protein